MLRTCVGFQRGVTPHKIDMMGAIVIVIATLTVIVVINGLIYLVVH